MIHVIFNPTAGGGYAGKIKPDLLSGIREKVDTSFSFHTTRYRGDATLSARRAVYSGAKLIICVGGDGTIQETVNGFFIDGKLINPTCELGIVSCGTGRGLASSLGLPQPLQRQLDLIANGSTIAMDVGQVTVSRNRGGILTKIFVSECQAGFGGTVVEGVRSIHKRFGGKLGFGSVALKQALRYKAQHFVLNLDSGSISRKLLGIVVGNGSSCGGGMKLTPGAKLNDGMFDVLLINNIKVRHRLLNFPKIYSGGHLHSPHFSVHKCNRMTIIAKEPVKIAADGELLGQTPCAIELLPNKLPVKCNGGI